MTSAATGEGRAAPLRVLLNPAGPWFALDDPRLDGQAEVQEYLKKVGLDFNPTNPPGTRYLGGLGTVVPANDPEGSPLVATLLAYRTEARVDKEWQTTTTDEGILEVTPERTVSVRTHELPLDGGSFRMLHVQYAIPSPDGRAVVLHFATPCLPERDIMEWIFDQSAAGTRFVEPDPDATDGDPDDLPSVSE